jgi:hypothetical protein
MSLENNMYYHHHQKKDSRCNNKHSKNNRHRANSHGHTDIAQDAAYLLENWQAFPVINTQVLLSTFPLFLTPVEHFKEVIRKIKDNKKESCSYYSEDNTNCSETSSCAETSGYSDESDSDCSLNSSDNTDDDNHSRHSSKNSRRSRHSRHSSKNSPRSRRRHRHTERKKNSPDDLLSHSTTIEESSPPVWDSTEWQD